MSTKRSALASVPASVQAMACDIARYNLFDDRASLQVTQRFTDAIKFLASIANNSCTLGIEEAVGTVAAVGGAQSTTVDRVFNSDTLADYAP